MKLTKNLILCRGEIIINKHNVGIVMCILGGILALIFGKPVIKANFDSIFAVVDIFIVAFGAGLMLGSRKL